MADNLFGIHGTALTIRSQRMAMLASNIANASTPGYKSEETTQRSFDDMLLFSRMEGYEVGSAGLGVVQTKPQLDLSQGPLEQTDEPLDIALDGEGWLVVRTADGPMYTRNGQLQTNADGALVTAAGLPVLSTTGDEIRVKTAKPVTFREDGTVESDGKAVGKLQLVTLGDPQKAGDGLVSGRNAGASGARVKQGFLEGSGLDAATTMIDMIVSLRAFEAGQRVLKAADETLQRALSIGQQSG